jgi:hypothetical protein
MFPVRNELNVYISHRSKLIEIYINISTDRSTRLRSDTIGPFQLSALGM